MYRVASLVIDTSAVVAVLLNEPIRAALISATEGCALVGAPTLPWEVGNALVTAVRRKRLAAAQVSQAWSSYQSVPVRLSQIDPGRAIDLALVVSLDAYDGYVLETARAERVPLLTLDLALARAARRLGLKLKEIRNEGLQLL